MAGQERPFADPGNARFDASVPLREDHATPGITLAGMVRRSLEPGLERHGAFRKAAGYAGAAIRHFADRAGLRARLCRFPLPGLRLAQGLSEARCIPRKDADAAFDQDLSAAAGVGCCG